MTNNSSDRPTRGRRRIPVTSCDVSLPLCLTSGAAVGAPQAVSLRIAPTKDRADSRYSDQGPSFLSSAGAVRTV